MSTTAADAYPVARFERTPYTRPPLPPPGPTATPPRSRFFNLETGSQASSRTTLSTPRLKGPVILQYLTWKHGSATDPPGHSLEIGWSTSEVRETQVSLTASKPWNALCERINGVYTAVPAVPFVGPVIRNTAGSGVIEQWPINMLITAPELFVTITYHNFTVANVASGSVELFLLEGVAPEVAANFH